MARRQHKNQPRMNRDLARAAKDQREQQHHDAMARLLSAIAGRARDETFTRIDALIEFEETRQIALHCHPPQASAAVAATMAKCKIMGLVIDRQQQVPPGQSPLRQSMEQEEEIMARIAERIGTDGAERFRQAIEIMREAWDGGDTIEGDPPTEIKE